MIEIESKKARRISPAHFTGAWMTDIDDTIIPSGVSPDDGWIRWISEKIACLARHHILWIPMSGVAIVKLGPRVLHRLPQQLLSGILYYGGDGSQKHYFDPQRKRWDEDHRFSRLFTGAQALAVLGTGEFLRSFSEKEYQEARTALDVGGFSSEEGILGEMKKLLSREGFDPGESETYFRGGSVSWMMLGDISAEPYREEKALRVRSTLIEYAEKRLAEENFLKRYGAAGINIPFPGARGIKFVLMGNDKERGTRDLIATESIDPSHVLFSGNELFRGGNDNMIRNIRSVTLLSVGERTDPGEFVVDGGVGVFAYRRWMDRICSRLDAGLPWKKVLTQLRESSQWP